MKTTLITTAMVLALAAPAYAAQDCSNWEATSAAGWAQARGGPSLKGAPLWRLTDGAKVKYCGFHYNETAERSWYWISFSLDAEPWVHEAWLSAKLLRPVETLVEMPPAAAPVGAPPAPAPALETVVEPAAATAAAVTVPPPPARAARRPRRYNKRRPRIKCWAMATWK
jgi:hypothetical protein